MEKNTDEILKNTAVILSASHAEFRGEAEVTQLLNHGVCAVIFPESRKNGDSVRNCREEYIFLPSVDSDNRGTYLKTAFRYILEKLPQVTSVVVADCCEPLSTEDLCTCAARTPEAEDKLILGTRNFNLPGIPSRFRFGNKSTSFMLRLCYGLTISDPQTGLRVIPRDFLERFCIIPGKGTEYDINMLLYLKRWGIGYVEQPISAVCGKTGSEHMHPLLDAWRVFRVMLKYVLSSLSSTVVDLSIYYLMMKFAGSSLGGAATLVSTVVARAISSFVNFNLNNSAVFGNKGNYRQALLRYYCLCIPQMLVSAGLVTLVNHLLAVTAPFLATVVKFVIDTCLFFISYQIQREWVFSGKKKT